MESCVAAHLGANVAGKVGVVTGDIRVGALHRQFVQVPHVTSEELAQNGSRPRRRRWYDEFLCCLAAWDSALCAFRQRCFLAGKFAHIADGVVVIERLKMIFQGLARDGYALLYDDCGFNRAERVPFDGVRCVSELDIVIMLKVGKRLSG